MRMLSCANTLLTSVTVLVSSAVAAQQGSIPANTPIVVRTSEAIDSRNANLAREYVAVLDEPLVVAGATLAPKGAEAILRVAEATRAGAVSGRASLTLQLIGVAVDGRRVAVESGGVTSESGSQAGKATRTGIGGAAIGAIIGGVVGGASGAAKGAAIGGTAGVGAAAVTGQRVQVPAETRLTFVLARDASLTPTLEAAAEPPPLPAPAPRIAAPARRSLPGAVVDQVHFQLTEAVADGKQLRLKFVALNQGVDRLVNFYVRNGPQIIDDRGNKYGYPKAQVLIGNQNWTAELLNGVRTEVVITVDDLATVGGVMQASEIKRLTIPVDVAKPGQTVIELRDILIMK